MMAHKAETRFLLSAERRVHLNWRRLQFSRLMVAEVEYQR